MRISPTFRSPPFIPKLISTAQNLCVRSASKTLGSNRIIPDTSRSTTEIRVKGSKPAPLVAAAVAHVRPGTSVLYDSWTKVLGSRDSDVVHYPRV